MKRYKCEALIKLSPQADPDGQAAVLAGPAGRVVIRASDPRTHATRLFSALFSRGGESAPDDSHLILTVTVVSDDAADCLAPGQPLTLWRGSDIGRGVVTRRVFV